MSLPVTVTDVRLVRGGLYEVTVALFDGSLMHYLVPPTLASAEAVSLSAAVLAMVQDGQIVPHDAPHRKHHRYLPRS